MADNVVLDAGAGGDTIAADDVAGVKYQIVKLAVGAADSASLVSNAAPIPVSDAGGALTVDGTVAVSGTVTVDGSGVTQPVSNAGLTELAAAINGSSQMDVNIAASNATVTVANTTLTNAHSADFDTGAGTDTTPAFGIAVPASGGAAIIPGDATAGLKVDLGADNDVTVTGTVTANLAAGTNNIGDVDVLSIAAGDNNIGNVDIVTMPNVTLAAGTNTNEVVGDVAHDAAAAGNPVQTGGYATNSIEGVTQVAAGDLTRTVHDLNGVQVVRPHTTLEELISERVTNTDGASTAFTNFAAGGSGVHNYITQVSIWNSSATDGFVDFRDGTAGAVKWTFPAPQTGGCNMNFDPPLKFADNTAVAFDVSGAISTIYISANGFQAQG